MNAQPFIIERTYDAAVDRVWKAITDKGEMKEWYFNLAEFKPEPGFKFKFYAGPPKGKQYLHICRVKEVVKEQKLSYTWQYENEPGLTLVTFELFPEGHKTRLKLTHEGLETFTSRNPDLAPENFAEGWNVIIGTSLKDYLEKNGSGFSEL